MSPSVTRLGTLRLSRKHREQARGTIARAIRAECDRHTKRIRAEWWAQQLAASEARAKAPEPRPWWRRLFGKTAIIMGNR